MFFNSRLYKVYLWNVEFNVICFLHLHLEWAMSPYLIRDSHLGALSGSSPEAFHTSFWTPIHALIWAYLYIFYIAFALFEDFGKQHISLAINSDKSWTNFHKNNVNLLFILWNLKVKMLPRFNASLLGSLGLAPAIRSALATISFSDILGKPFQALNSQYCRRKDQLRGRFSIHEYKIATHS